MAMGGSGAVTPHQASAHNMAMDAMAMAMGTVHEAMEVGMDMAMGMDDDVLHQVSGHHEGMVSFQNEKKEKEKTPNLKAERFHFLVFHSFFSGQSDVHFRVFGFR